MSAGFDYIVVGAGSAGCVVASRLSEDRRVRVLLIEAGPRGRNPLIHIPGALQQTINLNSANWGYFTVPQPHLHARRVDAARGRLLGGSSSINGMVYGRGMASDFDAWRQMGARGWELSDVTPFFRRAETFLPGPDQWHGDEGPVRVTRPTMRSPLSPVFLAAAAKLGYTFKDDITTRGGEGTGLLEGTYAGGKRQSTANTYLEPARNRRNLEIATDVLVRRVILKGKRATGVEYRQDGAVRQVIARREVILSAGSINSPQLLMLSGVGDGDRLYSLGIPVQLDRKAVGGNLHDHLICRIAVTCTEPVTLYKYTRSWGMITAAASYVLRRSGPLAFNPFEVTAFVRSRSDVEDPDIQMFFVPAAYAAAADKAGYKLEQVHGYTLHFDILRPRSRGSIRLASADPAVAPIIDPNYLADPDDRRSLRAGFRISRAILNQSPFEPYRGREIAPGEEVVSDSEVDAYLRAAATTAHHLVGTCRMGEDHDAVVDSSLRVRGIDGLRVADSSIMPRIVSSGTNFPTIMIGEKAADMIRRESV